MQFLIYQHVCCKCAGLHQSQLTWEMWLLAQAVWKQTAMRGQKTSLDCQFIFWSLGIMLIMSVRGWNRIEWKSRPSLRAQEGFSHFSDGEGMTAILLWSENDPLGTWVQKKKPLLMEPLCHAGSETEVELCGCRHNTTARGGFSDFFLLGWKSLQGWPERTLLCLFSWNVRCFCGDSLWQRSPGVLVLHRDLDGLVRTVDT